jgi:NDP-sugar pyrophosphorylase family protein
VSNVLYAEGRVVRYDKRAPTPDMRWIDYGLSVLTPDALAGSGADLAALMHELAEAGRLGGYLAAERFYEIGTPGSLAEAEAFLAAARETTPLESKGDARA